VRRDCVLLAALALSLLATPVRGGGRRPAADRPVVDASRTVLATLDAGKEKLWRRVSVELADMFGARTVSSWFMRSLGEQCLVLEAPAGKTAEALARRVGEFPGVSGATPVRRFRVLGEGEPDSYLSLETIYRQLNLADVHRTATGEGVRVAIIDTGLDVEHPELAGRIVRARDFVGATPSSFTSDVHGTEVAGIIAARADDATGIVGVAPGASLLALKACWQEPPGSRSAVCDTYTLALAIDDAIVEKARVLNLSLAGERDPLIERLLRQALRNGQVVVAAATGMPTSFPASVPGVIATYQWTSGPRAAELEAAGAPGGALSAAGSDLLTTVPHGRYDFASGSSFAAAQVSGAVALLLEKRPELDPPAVAGLLGASAGMSGGAGVNGPRRLDICAALSRALTSPVCGVRE